MKFSTRTVTGHGRGRKLGFPTINMLIPENVPLFMQQGVYAARAVVKGQKYEGALYYGPAPTFDQKEVALEIYLLDTVNFYIGEGEIVDVEVLKFIRPVMTFDIPDLLVIQMQKDEDVIRTVLRR